MKTIQSNPFFNLLADLPDVDFGYWLPVSIEVSESFCKVQLRGYHHRGKILVSFDSGNIYIEITSGFNAITIKETQFVPNDWESLIEHVDRIIGSFDIVVTEGLENTWEVKK